MASSTNLVYPLASFDFNTDYIIITFRWEQERRTFYHIRSLFLASHQERQWPYKPTLAAQADFTASEPSQEVTSFKKASRRKNILKIILTVFYRCVGPSMNKTLCWNGETSVNSSITDAISYEANGLIDPLQNLNHQKLFFWHGLLDEVLPQLRMLLPDYIMSKKDITK